MLAHWRGAREPLKYRPFRYWFAAQSISVFGSALSPVALAIGILRMTGSGGILGVTLAAGSVPTVVMLAVGGVAADRFNRSLVMVAANIVCAVTQIVMGTMLLGREFNVPLAVCLQIGFGFARAFYFPASTGLTAETVPTTSLQPANALLSLARSTAGSVGPLMAGVLAVTIGAGWALIGDGLTYVAGAVLLTQLTHLGRIQAKSEGGFRHQLAAGFREVTSRSWVWTSIVAFMTSQLSSAVLLVEGPVLLLGRHGGVAIWSGLIASLSLGQVAGDLLALRISPRHPMVAARVSELLTVPLLVALALNSSALALLPCAFLSGVSMTFSNTLWYTALQSNLKSNVLSRVSSYDWMGSLALRPLGLIAAPELADAIGSGNEFMAMALITMVVCSAALIPRQVRELETAPAVLDETVA
jgi:MFS family permease